jgi:hypothetical protein
MMAYSTLVILVLVLHASMGLNPPSPHRQQTRRLHSHSRLAHTVAGVLVAATLFTTPLPAEASLTKQDFVEIGKIVNESEERMTVKLMESEERMTVKLKESEERTQERMKKSEERLTLNIDKQAFMFMWVPIISGLVSAGITSTKLDDAIGRNSIKWDTILAGFVSQKDAIMKELEANTQSKATQGTVSGVLLTLVLMSSGAMVHHQ